MGKWNRIIENKKKCSECGRVKPVSSYYFVRPGVLRAKCIKCYSRLNVEKMRDKTNIAWFRRKFERLKANALTRSITFNLSFTDYLKLKGKPCFYCDETYPIMTVDRVDSAKDYHSTNCVSACFSCNRAKNSITVEACRRVVAFIDKI